MGEIAVERTTRMTGLVLGQVTRPCARVGFAPKGWPSDARRGAALPAWVRSPGQGMPEPPDMHERRGWRQGSVRPAILRLAGPRPAVLPPPGLVGPEGARPARARPDGARQSHLTRRGRALTAALALLGAVVAGTLLGLDLSARAQAAGATVAGSGRSGLAVMVVRPGDSLWTIALRAQPGADPRNVEQQIMRINRLRGTSLDPGERLLVPVR